MKTIDKAFRSYQQRLSDAAEDLLRMLSLTHEGFLKHKKGALEEAEKLGSKVHEFEKEFAEGIVKEQDKEVAKLLIALAGHIERIGDCIENVIRTVHTKIREGTLFSDKAVTELNQVFGTSRELIGHVRDIVMTLNPVLMQHVVRYGEELSRKATEFATAHEERLVMGVCQPKHSSMYLDIVDNLRTSVWHLKEMVGKLQ
jgi:Na+/phosphate symporter